jgi:hypothetical protein
MKEEDKGVYMGDGINMRSLPKIKLQICSASKIQTQITNKTVTPELVLSGLRQECLRQSKKKGK